MKNLTPREREIADFLVTGAENKAIADRLGIGAETVKTHVCSMLIKLEARNRTHLAVKYDRMQRPA